MKKFFEFIKESYAELKKVSWPSKDDVVAQTVVVLVSLAIVSVLLALIDFGALQLVVKLVTF